MNVIITILLLVFSWFLVGYLTARLDYKFGIVESNKDSWDSKVIITVTLLGYVALLHLIGALIKIKMKKLMQSVEKFLDFTKDNKENK